jgi:protein ImuB
MGLAAAVNLCPTLQVLRHDPVCEAAALDGLAAWAGAYTSRSSLQPPRGLLMEIGGSLGLFGGLGPLLERVRRDLRALGYQACPAVAPTPTGAWLLARCGDASPVTLGEQLAGRLSRVPVSCMDLPASSVEDLAAMGVHSFGDCARLPRDGLARRMGPQLLSLLDRALGRRSDPRACWTPPAQFQRRLDLPVESVDRALLLQATRRLLHELCGFLAARASGAAALELQLAHRAGPGTQLVLELVTPSRDPRHLLALVRERLERVELEREVLYLGLRVQRLVTLAPESGELFPQRGHSTDPRQAVPAQVLVERLGARLGRDAVRGLQRIADHRPERASVAPPWHQCAGQAAQGRRAPSPVQDPGMPLWLLPRPRHLDGGPVPALDGALEIESGPCRIESGWWDGDDVARDYYVARSARGTRYWIFRERRGSGRWFVHGIFA